VDDQLDALGRAGHVGRDHGVALDPVDPGPAGLGATGQGPDGPAVAGQGRGGLAADAAGRADHQGDALLGRGHVDLRS